MPAAPNPIIQGRLSALKSRPPVSLGYAAAALALVVVGGWLRLHDLPSMEFKFDEQNALVLASEIGWSRSTWPNHGMLSSGGVGNAPLFTWIVAAMRRITPDPIGVTAAIAAINTLCLLPLWLWALRRMDHTRALLLLAAVSVSPFAVFYSRKIWTQDLLLPGVLLILWGIEWLRDGRTWRGVIALAGATLVAGQLHQSGPIALVLLPLAMAIQWRIDRGAQRVAWRLSWPTKTESVVLTMVVALNLLFWLPYLGYLATVPAATFLNRPEPAALRPFLLQHLGGQVAPSDLLYFFEWDRMDFLGDPTRLVIYRATLVLGIPLFAYGVWRWLRSPGSLPVIAIWWGLVIVAFMLTRIPVRPFYTLILAPAPAFLAAGGFDPPNLGRLVEWLLRAWRIAYVVALLLLTVLTQRWISERGGATPDYGITYEVRRGQARNIVASISGRQQDGFARGFTMNPEPGAPLNCDAPPPEVHWLVASIGPPGVRIPEGLQLCERWMQDGGRMKYQWRIQTR
jgi:hypothetical protein